MNPLSSWLQDLGLAQYLPPLEQHGADLRSMPLLARELLAPLYGWFTEGFDCADLKQSRALLDGLEAHP